MDCMRQSAKHSSSKSQPSHRRKHITGKSSSRRSGGLDIRRGTIPLFPKPNQSECPKQSSTRPPATSRLWSFRIDLSMEGKAGTMRERTSLRPTAEGFYTGLSFALCTLDPWRTVALYLPFPERFDANCPVCVHQRSSTSILTTGSSILTISPSI